MPEFSMKNIDGKSLFFDGQTSMVEAFVQFSQPPAAPSRFASKVTGPAPAPAPPSRRNLAVGKY
jgi:hypothetical protein